MKKYSVWKGVLLGLMLFALNDAFAAGWYSDFSIAQLQYSRGADGVHIVYAGGTGNANPDNCDNSDRFLVPYTSANPMREKAMLSGVVTAHTTGQKVRVYLSGCISGIGGSTYPAVWYFFAM